MINIGQKVKFTKYIPINIIDNKPLRKTLKGNKLSSEVIQAYEKENIRKFINNCTTAVIKLDKNISCYKTVILSTEEKEGIVVGTVYRKLNRFYNFNRSVPSGTLEIEIGLPEAINPNIPFFNRPSKNPFRLDDPRKKQPIVLVSIKNSKIIGVPLYNILSINNYIRIL